MQSGRYINSVSDLLYSTDEIEFLLDDIKDLEPTSCKPEDIQDWEIGGSRGGGLSTSASAVECGGPAGCNECESPIGTVNSWDSHSHYRRRTDSPDFSLYSGVIVYCDHHHLTKPTGIIRLLLLATSLACLTCLCTSGSTKVGLFMLPLAGRIRLMMFVSLISILVTIVVLFLEVTHVIYLFPFNWGKLNAYFYIGLSFSFLLASSLLFHMVFLAEAFSWVPRWSHHQIMITGCLGYLCCLQSVVLSAIQYFFSKRLYEPVVEDPSTLNLQERQNTPNQTQNYKPIINYSPMIVTSTSSNKVNNKHNYLDDVQPCSSKSVDNRYIPYKTTS